MVDLDDDHLFFLGDQRNGSNTCSSTSASGSSSSKGSTIAQSLHGAAELPRGPALVLRKRLLQLCTNALGKGSHNSDGSTNGVKSGSNSSSSAVSSSMTTSNGSHSCSNGIYGGNNGVISHETSSKRRLSIAATQSNESSHLSEWFDSSVRDAALLFMVQCLDG